MKKILVTGGNGQVAYELVRLLRAKGIDYLAPSREELDITQSADIDRVMSHSKPTAVINAAAYTRVDLAEREVDQANAVNNQGAKHLAIACAKAKSLLLHLSTDYVFDGQKTIPYLESDLVAPLNVYGASKWQGELAVQEQYERAMILRVSGVFGIHGNNFVKTMLRLAKEREVLRVVADQIICPTSAKAIAETSLNMLLNPQPGVYHYCGAQATNWYALTQWIIEIAHSLNQPLVVKQLNAITTADYPTPAKRPRYSVLNCQRIADVFGILQPDWRQGVIDVITQLSAT